MKGATSVLLGVNGLRSHTYQHCVGVVGVAVGVGRVDRQGHAVREDGEQDEPFEWSAQNGVKENTQRTRVSIPGSRYVDFGLFFCPGIFFISREFPGFFLKNPRFRDFHFVLGLETLQRTKLEDESFAKKVSTTIRITIYI